MAAEAVGEQRTPGAVVDFAIEAGLAGAAVALGAPGGAAVLAIGAAVEVTQVGLQAACRQGQVMHQTQEVLLVVVVQVAVVVLRGQVLADPVIATGKVELVAVGASRRTADTQAHVIGRRAGLGVFQLAAGQGQAVDLVGDDLPTLEGLRQQATVVEVHHGQLRQQGAESHFGPGDAQLGGGPGLAVVVHGAAVGFGWKQLAGRAIAGRAAVAAAIEAEAVEGDDVNAETQGAFGETGLVVEDEALSPFVGFAVVVRGVLVVQVVVEVAQV